MGDANVKNLKEISQVKVGVSGMASGMKGVGYHGLLFLGLAVKFDFGFCCLDKASE